MIYIKHFVKNNTILWQQIQPLVHIICSVSNPRESVYHQIIRERLCDRIKKKHSALDLKRERETNKRKRISTSNLIQQKTHTSLKIHYTFKAYNK